MFRVIKSDNNKFEQQGVNKNNFSVFAKNVLKIVRKSVILVQNCRQQLVYLIKRLTDKILESNVEVQFSF